MHHAARVRTLTAIAFVLSAAAAAAQTPGPPTSLTASINADRTLTLFAARLAHGFVESGVLRAVPPGAAEHNVRFVAQHEIRIAALLKGMGIED